MSRQRRYAAGVVVVVLVVVGVIASSRGRSTVTNPTRAHVIVPAAVVNRASDGCGEAWNRTMDVAQDVKANGRTANPMPADRMEVTADATRRYDTVLGDDLAYVGKAKTPVQWRDRMQAVLRDCNDMGWQAPAEDLPVLNNLGR